MKLISASAIVALAPIAGGSTTTAQTPAPQPTLPAAARPNIVDREVHLASLREKARRRADQDAKRFAAAELADIEVTYQSTRWSHSSFADRSGRHQLQALVEKYIRERDGWAVVMIVAAAFYLSAFGILRMWRGVASARPVSRRERLAAHLGVLFIAAIFLNSYAARVGTMPVYWVWIVGLVFVVTAYMARTTPILSRPELSDADH